MSSLSFTFSAVGGDLLNEHRPQQAAEWKNRLYLREREHQVSNFKELNWYIQWEKACIEIF